MGLKNEIVKSNVEMAASRFVAYFFVFLFSILVARLLGPEQFGIYAFFLAVAGFFGIFTDMGLSGVAVRFLAEFNERREYGKSKNFLAKMVKYKILLVSIVVLFVALFHGSVAAHVFSKPELAGVVLLAIPLIVFTSFSSIVVYASSALKDFLTTSLYTLTETILRFIVVVGLLLLGFGVQGAIVGTIVAAFALLVFATFMLVKRHRNVFSATPRAVEGKSIKHFGLWIMAATLIGSLYSAADQFIVAALLPIEELGFYRIAMGWAIASAGIIPITSFVMYPYMSSAGSMERTNRILLDAVRYTSLMALPMAFLLSAFSEPVIEIFYGISYAAAAKPLSVIALAVVPITLSNLLYPYFAATNRPRTMAFVGALTFVVTIGLLFFLSRTYGLLGAAVAVVSGRLLETLVLFAITRTALAKDFLFFFKYLAAVLIVYFAASNTRPNNLLELLLSGLGGLVLYIALTALFGGIDKNDVKTVLGALKSQKAV